LRRPHADILEDGLHELRTRQNKVRLRMLYFFDKKTAVITHGFVKNVARVPRVEIKRASRFRERYLADPDGHTHEEG
jgi:phage-related protein